MRIAMANKDSEQMTRDAAKGSVTAGGQSRTTNKSKASSNMANQTKEIKQNMKLLEN